MRLGFRGLVRAVLSAALFFVTLQTRAQTSVWIDTDPALGMLLKDADDSFALAYALRSPRVRVEGISLTFGNSSMSNCLRVTQSTVQQFSSNPKAQLGIIYPGALNRNFLGMATEATVALQQALNKKKLIYVALGPLTNLATLLQTRPTLAKNIDQIIWVAGRKTGSALKIGSTNPFTFHDSNFEKDPLSAAIVFAAKIPVTLVSRELAQDFLVTRDDQKAISDSGPGGKWLAKESDHWMTLWKTGWNTDGGPIPDVLAVIAVTHPSSLQSEPRFAGLSMDMNSVVPPKDGQTAKFLLVGSKLIANQDRPVTYISDIDNSAKENWLRTMTEKAGAR
jgi:inosine-uridine nucleoside N-ribohydrolase